MVLETPWLLLRRHHQDKLYSCTQEKSKANVKIDMKEESTLELRFIVILNCHKIFSLKTNLQKNT